MENRSMPPLQHLQDFLAGGGEMGELIRAYDWAQTTLGPPQQWPHSLRTIVRIMLTSQQPIWLGWGNELIKLYNDPYKSIVGGKHPWALGKPASVVWKDIWEAVGPRLSKVMSSNEGTYDESLLLIMERNGYPEETYYTFSYSPIPDDAGNIGGIFCANTDDTQRIIGERQLTLLRDLASRTVHVKTLSEIYSQTALSLKSNLKDLPFSLIYMMDNTSEQLQLVASSGIPLNHGAAPESVPVANGDFWPFQQVLSTGQALVVQDLQKKFNNLPCGAWDRPPHQAVIVPISQSGQIGKTGLLVVGLNPLRQFDQNYQGFINLLSGQVAASISNVQTLEAERKRAEALAEIDKAKTVFFSNISHEFRTPLTLMLGPVEDALNDPLTIPANLERLTTAHRNAHRLLRLVNSLLDFSRLEAGRIQAVYRETDLCTLTNDLSSAFRSVIENAGLRYVVNCTFIAAPVYVDTTMWERIVFNLLSNAYKFTLKGEIILSLQESGSDVVLKVSDTGTGIPEAELSKLFSRFHRVENAKGRTHEGSGIGLAMVSELVRLHGGSVYVESKLGIGTTFTVHIPTGKEHLPTSQIADQEAVKSITLNALPDLDDELGVYQTQIVSSKIDPLVNNHAFQKEKILIADDNADMRDYLVRLLGKDYEVKAVADGNEAVEAMISYHPALLLSDIMMPNLDGLELLKKLRSDEQTKTVPVIFLSARAGEEAKIQGIEAGADDYLVKPFNAKELLAKVQTNLSLSAIRKQTQIAVGTERQRLYDLFMQAPANIAVLIGPDHVFELANPRYMRLVGSHRELIGKPIREALPDISGQGFFEILDNVYLSGKPFIGNEIPVKIDQHGTGKLEDFYLNFVYQPTKDEHGKVYGVLVHAVDITEQVVIRRKIEESEQKYRTLFNSMDQGFCLMDLIFDSTDHPIDYRFVEVNPTFEKQTGLKGAEGKTAKELVPNLEQKWFDLYGKVALTGEALRFIEGSVQMGRWFEVYAFRIGGDQSRRIAILFTDISERKKAEDDLRKKNEQLIKTNNDLDNFIYTASHDLKAPVSNIEGLIKTLSDVLSEESKNSEDFQMVLGLIEKSIGRFKNTILDLTEISKAQKLEEEDVKEINCREIIDDVRFTIADKIKDAAADILIDTSESNFIKFSRKNFQSIVYNLLSNAIKYRDPKKNLKVEIFTKQEDGFVTLSIKDNGLGISEANKEKLFSMFKRFHDHVEGTGIGLYIVKRIIDNAGGKIEVETKVNEGSRFKVYFPVK